MGVDAPQMEDAACGSGVIRIETMAAQSRELRAQRSGTRGRSFRPSRRSLAASFTAVLTLGCGLGGGGSKPGDEAPPPEVTLYGVRMAHFKGDDLATSGRAAKLTYVRTTGELTAFESFFRFPNRRAKQPRRRGAPEPGIDVRAPVVVGSLSTRQARVEGGVYMRGAEGMVAQTERVYFDGNAFVARGDTRCRVEGPGYALSADQFTLDFVPEVFTFEGNVETELGSDG